jgi:hypothetical protein
MTRPKFLFFPSILLTICLLGISAANAQSSGPQPIDANYEVLLQVVLGSNDASRQSDLPANLSGVARQLKSNFSFSNYQLVNTYLGRVANTGSLEYKSIANIFGQESELESPSFLDWRLGRIRNVPASQKTGAFDVEGFRFGARVPVKVTNYRDESGKPMLTINYEPVGLNLDKLNIGENLPTLIGTLSLPKTNGTAFLVLTIKSARD